MRNITLYVTALTLGLLIGTGVFLAQASGDYPFDNGVYVGLQSTVEGCPDGYVCVTEEEYVTHWDVCPRVTATSTVETSTPTATEPERTPTPSTTPTPETTPITPTPETTPTEKPKCNRGIGNFEEGCDPGNSYGQGGGSGRPAGEDRFEDQGPPGNQNHQH